MKLLLPALAALLFLSGCGYKPMAHYHKKVLGGSVYTIVELPLAEPENALVIKDALNEAVVAKFKARLVEKEAAETIIHIRKTHFSIDGLQKDENGFTVLYRATVALDVEIRRNGEKRTMEVTGLHDFPMEADSLESEARKNEALRIASLKAMDELVARLAATGFMTP